MKTAKSNSKKRGAVGTSVDIPTEQYVRLVRCPSNRTMLKSLVESDGKTAGGLRVSLQNQLRDLFAENDMVLSLSKRLQQKLFGDCEASAPVATPKTLEAWIIEATRMAKESHALLATLNERIEAD